MIREQFDNEKCGANCDMALPEGDTYVEENPPNQKAASVEKNTEESLRLDLFPIWVVLHNFMSIIVLYVQTYDENHPVNNTFVIVMVIMAFCEIFFSMFIVRLKKWALFSYIILAGVFLVISLLQLNYFTIIVRLLLLLLLFIEDWEKFR